MYWCKTVLGLYEAFNTFEKLYHVYYDYEAFNTFDTLKWRVVD